jgi:hypothetical protein
MPNRALLATCFPSGSNGLQGVIRIPDDSTLHNHRCENLKSYNHKLVVLKFGTQIIMGFLYVLTFFQLSDMSSHEVMKYVSMKNVGGISF